MVPSLLAKPAGLDLENLTAEDVAALLGVTSRAVRLWPADGCPFHSIKGKSNRFRWREVFRWWLDHRHRPAAVAAPGGKVSRPEAEARKAAAEARLKELRLAREEGRLVAVEDVEAEWTRKVVTARARLLALPARVRAPLGPEAAAMVDAEIRAVLADLAQGSREGA